MIKEIKKQLLQMKRFQNEGKVSQLKARLWLNQYATL
jgi:hypothetical protein